MPKVNIPVVPRTPVATPIPSPQDTSGVSPSPTPVAATYNPEVEAWFYDYANYQFDRIYSTFVKMGTDANNNDLNGIIYDCQSEINYALALKNGKPVPDASMQQNLVTIMTRLAEGGTNCASGVNGGNTDQAVNGVNEMQDAILALIALQQEIIPSN